MGDLFVSPTGNDSSAGNVSHPFLTIGKAGSVAQPGDTVHVLPGTYNVDGGNGAPPYPQATYALHTTASGTSLQRIRYVSDIRLAAKIVATGADMAWRQDGNYVDIIGFDVTTALGNWGISIGNDFCTTQGCFVHDMTGMIAEQGATIVAGAGISHANFNATNNWMLGNKVTNIFPSPASDFVHGLYLAHSGGGAINNIVCNISGHGVMSWHFATAYTMAHNLCINIRNAGINVACDHLVQTCTGCKIVNNIIRDNRSDGNPLECFAIYQGEGTVGAHNTYDRNVIWGGNTIIHFDSGGDTPTNTMNVDPLMNNYRIDGTGDYHLKPNSPCIDIGNPFSLPYSFDFDGNKRPSGYGYDIGPYEVRGVSFHGSE